MHLGGELDGQARFSRLAFPAMESAACSEEFGKRFSTPPRYSCCHAICHTLARQSCSASLSQALAKIQGWPARQAQITAMIAERLSYGLRYAAESHLMTPAAWSEIFVSVQMVLSDTG